MPEHPAIARALATGRSEAIPRGAKICCDCGGALSEGESYYYVAGNIYCESCISLRREEVEE